MHYDEEVVEDEVSGFYPWSCDGDVGGDDEEEEEEDYFGRCEGPTLDPELASQLDENRWEDEAPVEEYDPSDPFIPGVVFPSREREREPPAKKRKNVRRAEEAKTVMTWQGERLPPKYMAGVLRQERVRSLPEKWPHACHYDCHTFDWDPPVGHPISIRMKKVTLRGRGFFCSLSCLVRATRESACSLRDMPLVHEMARVLYNWPWGRKLPCAFPRERLKLFGGDLEIDEWRRLSNCEDARVEEVPSNVVYDPGMLVEIRRKTMDVPEDESSRRINKERARKLASKCDVLVPPLGTPTDLPHYPKKPGPLPWENIYRRVHGHRPNRHMRKDAEAQELERVKRKREADKEKAAQDLAKHRRRGGDLRDYMGIVVKGGPE